MTYVAPIRAAPSAMAGPWRPQLIQLAIAIVAILLLFHRDAADIVSIWWTSSTFGHCLLILPIIGWLVWQRREGLALLIPRTWLPGLIPAAIGGFGWMLGEAAGVGLARHLGLMLMLQGSVIALLGPKVSRALLFPLAYLILAVPFGEEFVPAFQTLTAKMCMALLALVGLPARLDGIFITTPSGYFEVAAACAGVNFLIAMLAYSVLVAHLCFQSWGRRIGFVAFAVATSILANGVRAWGTIYISHLTSIDFAAGFDHIFYGWIFFALVIALVMAIGWRFFDRPVGDPAFDPQTLMEPQARSSRVALPALFAVIALPMLWTSAVAATGREELPHAIALPEVPGWTRAPLTNRHPWYPRFVGADHGLFGRYRNTRGDEVDLAIVLYGYQAEGREMIAYGQGAAAPESGWAWTTGARDPAGGHAERITGRGPVTREVLSFYRVGSLLSGSATRVKLETLKTRLLGGSQAGAAVLVSAEEQGGKSARPAIDRFLADLGPVDKLADALVAEARGR